MKNEVKINENGDLATSDTMMEIIERNKSSGFNSTTTNKTCSGKNRGGCNNTLDCSATTNYTNCTNQSTCVN